MLPANVSFFQVEFCCFGTMPPKTKSQRRLEESLEKARESKRIREDARGSSSGVVSTKHGEGSGTVEVSAQHGEPEGLADLLMQPKDALDTEDEEIDPIFDLDCSMKSDSGHIAESFCEEWVCQLEWDNRASLGLFLCFQLTNLLGTGETEAAELAGIMIGKSDKTICEWRSNFFKW